MPLQGLPEWTLAPLPALVLAIAVLPIVRPKVWEKRLFQGFVVSLCAVPVIVQFALAARFQEMADAAKSYVSFVATLGALYITSGGVQVSGAMDPKPIVNVAWVALGAALASFVGTTGASMLLIRPLLWTNRRRVHRAHLVPFFIITVANAGGLLTPLGDPPLLVGYIGGVPFFWTLRLFPAWLLYVGSAIAALYVVDRRAYARERLAVVSGARGEVRSITLRGKRNVALMLAVVPAALLPVGFREFAMVVISGASWGLTSRSLRRDNGFTFAPIIDVAIVFIGLFICLRPIEIALAGSAPWLPLRHGWQLFWASGLLSAVLDNVPTYTAFAALARGLSRHGSGLIAGISAWNLAAVSVGSVVMGGTTYIGNGPNLMVKAIAERQSFPTPGFFRYALFAFVVMLPAHVVMTVVLVLFDR